MNAIFMLNFIKVCTHLSLRDFSVSIEYCDDFNYFININNATVVNSAVLRTL